VAQSVEKVARGVTRIGTAEEVIAVTTEGIPVAISTGAQETMSFQDAAQKVGGVIRVSNMKEFFQTGFGKLLSAVSEKTNYRFQEKAIYKITEKLKQYGLKIGDVFYSNVVSHILRMW
jgi:septum formation inhibitor-activating ATPase MinD